MAGHGSPRPPDQADHPARQVDRPDITRQWPTWQVSTQGNKAEGRVGRSYTTYRRKKAEHIAKNWKPRQPGSQVFGEAKPWKGN